MRRVVRWIGWGAFVILLIAMVLPYLLTFESSGTLTADQAARRSLGAAPTFLTVDGIDVHVERVAYRGEPGADEADGEPDDTTTPLIVVLHGFGANTATWRTVLSELAVVGEVVAYDRPPFGFTERPAAGGDGDAYGTDGQLALLTSVIDAYRGDDPDREVVLLGHSAGGSLAAEFALRRPGEVDALVLVAPAVLTTGGAPGWVRPVLGFGPIDRWGPWLARAAANGADALLERSWHDPSLLTDDLRSRYDEPRQVAGWEQGL